MFSVKIDSCFSAAHNLRGYKGNCEELHGHNWKIEVTVASNTLDKSGMVVDFRELRAKLSEVLETLDHKYLNNLTCFKEINPTSENVAKYIYDHMKSGFYNIKSITVWESANSSATYSE